MSEKQHQKLSVPRESKIISLGGAVIAVLFTLVNIVSMIVSVSGLFFLVFGIRRKSSKYVGLGSLLLFASVILAALEGVSTLFVLAATVGAVVAWDSAEFGVTLGKQTGNENVRRIQTTHVGTVTAVTLITGVGAYGIYSLSSAGKTTATLLLLLVGGLLLLVSLESEN